jgi:hypothetical protein
MSPLLIIARLNDLADEGYMRRIWLPTDATPDEIRAAVLDGFVDAKFTELVEYGFRLLRVKAQLKQVNGGWKRKKGAAPRLSPIKRSKELNMMNWERYAVPIANHLKISLI